MFTNTLTCLFLSSLCLHTLHNCRDSGVDCGPPDRPTQGTTEHTSTEYGAEAKYVCNTGYVLSGVSSAVCTTDGTWSSRPPTCTSELTLLLCILDLLY